MKENDESLIEIGKNIKRLRKLRGMSQEDIALAAGVGLSYYGRIERGEQNMSVLVLKSIATALRVSVEKIIPTPEDFDHLPPI